MQSRSPPMHARRCRGFSPGCRHKPIGLPAIPLLVRAGRVPGGRVSCGVRHVPRSVDERVWSALGRRGWLLGTCDTAGDRGGVRCQAPRYCPPAHPIGDSAERSGRGGGGGASGQSRLAGVISGVRLHKRELVRFDSVQGAVGHPGFLRSRRSVRRRRHRLLILTPLSHRWPADEALRRCRSPRHDARSAHKCEGDGARGGTVIVAKAPAAC